MSDNKSLLDSSGNIDTKLLSTELKNALEFDIKYKQTDNMKKKAIKVASDYDQFKAMVSCAHLKKLSRKEVEELSTPMKGWNKKKISLSNDKAPNILQDEKDKLEISKSFLSMPRKDLPKAKPKSPIEAERELNKLKTFEEKTK